MKNRKENKEFKVLISKEDGVYEVVDYSTLYWCITIVLSIFILWYGFISSNYSILICIMFLPFVVDIIIFSAFTDSGLKKN